MLFARAVLAVVAAMLLAACGSQLAERATGDQDLPERSAPDPTPSRAARQAAKLAAPANMRLFHEMACPPHLLKDAKYAATFGEAPSAIVSQAFAHGLGHANCEMYVFADAGAAANALANARNRGGVGIRFYRVGAVVFSLVGDPGIALELEKQIQEQQVQVDGAASAATRGTQIYGGTPVMGGQVGSLSLAMPDKITSLATTKELEKLRRRRQARADALASSAAASLGMHGQRGHAPGMPIPPAPTGTSIAPPRR